MVEKNSWICTSVERTKYRENNDGQLKLILSSANLYYDVIWHLDDDAVGNDVVHGTVVLKEENRQANGKEKSHRKVLQRRPDK